MKKAPMQVLSLSCFLWSTFLCIRTILVEVSLNGRDFLAHTIPVNTSDCVSIPEGSIALTRERPWEDTDSPGKSKMRRGLGERPRSSLCHTGSPS